MKNYYLAFITLISISCESQTKFNIINTDLTPVYFDIENDLQEENLYGKVKKIEFYDISIQNKEVLKSINEYTNFGDLKKTEYYDKFGKLEKTEIIEYNNDKELISGISINELNNSKIISKFKYDTIKNTREMSLYINDSLDHKKFNAFDKNDYPINYTSIKNKDTIQIICENVYTTDKKLLTRKQIIKSYNQPTLYIQDKYVYNSKGNLIKSIRKSEGIISTSEIEWKNDRITKETESFISKDSVKQIISIIEFDKLYNITNLMRFRNSKLVDELKTEYKFDQNGNWVEKKVLTRRDSIKSKIFIPDSSNKRKISYWE